MFKVLKLGHVEFEVQDLGRMTEFYREVIGLTVTDRDADTAYLSTVIDHHSVILRQGRDKIRLIKIAFQMAPTEPKDLVRHLEDRGAHAEIRTDSQLSINQVVRTMNPDGMAIELYSECEPASHPFCFRGVNPLKLFRLLVNGRVRQQSNTSQMLFTAAEQIAHLSSRLTLNPGDVILTGTSAGVGAETGEFLKSGDVVHIEIERLGSLTTTIGSLFPPAIQSTNQTNTTYDR